MRADGIVIAPATKEGGVSGVDRFGYTTALTDSSESSNDDQCYLIPNEPSTKGE